MAKQLITIGTPGAGGGDPAHVSFKKINDNANELYNQLGVDAEGNLPAALPILKGGTGATTAAAARSSLAVPARSEVIGLGQNHIPSTPISGVTYYNTSPALMLIFLAIPTTALVSGFVNNVNVVNFGGVAYATNIMAVPAGASYRFENPTNAEIVIYYELR